MPEIKMITRENIPCWYELSWQSSPPAIILRIHQKFIKSFESKVKLTLATPIVESFMSEFDFFSFNGDFGKNFGFNQVFKRGKAEGNFIEFIIDIPVIKKEVGKCESCNGLGQDLSIYSKCFFCGGSGKKFGHDWLAAYAISATFSTLFVILYDSRTDTGSSFCQLLTLKAATLRDSNGCSLDGDYGIPLVSFLRSFNHDSDVLEMIEAMKVAHNHMFGCLNYVFGATVSREGWLNVNCSDSRVGLNPIFGSSLEKDRGYHFESHNVDTPVQQIALLAGLAALCDLARKSGY
jgi:hypothetical protein